MRSRVVAAGLWFAVAWVGYEVAWSLAGVPRVLGPILATVVSTFVVLDPLGLFFLRATRDVAPVEKPSVALGMPR
jgi:hypothetical protein